MNKDNFMFIILLLDDPRTVNQLNQKFKRVESPNFKMQAFGPITQMVGLQHKGRRPTHIVDMIQDRSHPKFDEWYTNCVLPNAVKAELTRGVL